MENGPLEFSVIDLILPVIFEKCEKFTSIPTAVFSEIVISS